MQRISCSFNTQNTELYFQKRILMNIFFPMFSLNNNIFCETITIFGFIGKKILVQGGTFVEFFSPKMRRELEKKDEDIKKATGSKGAAPGNDYISFLFKIVLI